MDKATFERQARRALLYYALDSDDYEATMDAINTAPCSDAQWSQLERWLAEADEDMVAAGIGTLAQTERVLAQRENRPSRWPGVFYLGTDAERAQLVAQVRFDLIRRGIRFADKIVARHP